MSISHAQAMISPDVWDRLDPKIKKQCEMNSAHAFPKDMPSNFDRAKLKNCNPEEFYYGIKSSPDYINARHCAFINHSHDILAMIYANGYGVEKNIDLAIHYICLYDGSPYEIQERIKDLNARQNNNLNQDKFEVCDYASSHLEVLKCTGIYFEEQLVKDADTIKN